MPRLFTQGDTLKVCVVGPKGSGKTVLCKLLAEQVLSAQASREYQPTAGLRIQELELEHKGRQRQVQLWDLSGDPSYEKYFAMLAEGTTGVLLVHNAQKDQESDLEVFYRVSPSPTSSPWRRSRRSERLSRARRARTPPEGRLWCP